MAVSMIVHGWYVAVKGSGVDCSRQGVLAVALVSSPLPTH